MNQELFKYLKNECEFIALESNLQEIERICTKDLIESLKAIAGVTKDVELPLLKAINQIANKTLKLKE